MTWKGIWAWADARMRFITYGAGSALVTIWTVVRHLTNGVNFDVVGQIGVADQWARGLHSSAQFGATNYVLKLPFYFLVNTFGFLSPHAKLLLLALVFNVATFILLLFLFEKLLRLYDVRPGALFYVAMIWLATISGRVYWLDYANSRNLETVGGVLVLYLACRAFKQTTWRRVALLAGVGGLVFFADQLQMYAIGGGVLVYAALLYVKHRSKTQLVQTSWLMAGVAGAFVIATVLRAAVVKLLPITFLAAPRVAPDQSLFGTLSATVKGVGVSTGRVFDASFYASGSAPNLLRELLNAAILVAVVGAIVYFWRKVRPGQLAALCVCCIATAYLAYAASYQALQPITERYIVMVPLLVILLFASIIDRVHLKNMRLVEGIGVAALSVSTLLIAGALVVSWPTRYSKDAYITDTLAFMQQNGFALAVSSRDGIPTTYFAEGKAMVLPTICLPDHTLIESNLFYDRAAFNKLKQAVDRMPLIVPGGGINSSGSLCTVQDVEHQFGPPLERLDVPGVGTAEIYNPANLQLHE